MSCRDDKQTLAKTQGNLFAKAGNPQAVAWRFQYQQPVSCSKNPVLGHGHRQASVQGLRKVEPGARAVHAARHSRDWSWTLGRA
jgi:hypothetical protein